jgi:DNA-directed RNA polymerase subunit L
MENKRKNHAGIAFWEYEITLARKMLDTLRTTVEFLYYLMDHRSKAPFSMILITSDKVHSGHELQRMKRGTDLLFELDKEHGTYVFICQATDKEGGKQYAEILLSSIRTHWGASESYCVLSTFDSTHYSIQDVIFRMVETYIHAHKVSRSGEVIVSSLDDTTTADNPLPA